MKRINIQKCQTFYFKTSIDNEEDKHPEMPNNFKTSLIILRRLLIMKRINIQKCQTFYFKTSIDNEEDKHPEMTNILF